MDMCTQILLQLIIIMGQKSLHLVSSAMLAVKLVFFTFHAITHCNPSAFHFCLHSLHIFCWFLFKCIFMFVLHKVHCPSCPGDGICFHYQRWCNNIENDSGELTLWWYQSRANVSACLIGTQSNTITTYDDVIIKRLYWPPCYLTIGIQL